MAETQTYTDTLVVAHCCACGMPFGMTRDFQQRRLDDGEGWYCPRGHLQYYTKPTIQRLKEDLWRRTQQRDRARAQLDSERDQHGASRRQLAATKGVVTRTKNRIKNGVCPCCNRQFENLAGHMKTKHPDYGEPDHA